MLNSCLRSVRLVHSRRQIKRFLPPNSPFFHRHPLPPRKPLSSPDVLTATKARFRAYNINTNNRLYRLSLPSDGVSSEKIQKFPNGFVPPPPVSLPPHLTADGPTFRIPRSKKARGTGFYKIYTTYKNQASRTFTDVRVLGNVVDFCAGFEAMVVKHGDREQYTSRGVKGEGFVEDAEWSEEKMKQVMGREEWLVDVKPGSKGEYKVRIRGRWKKDLEEWIWGMGM
mmetsp:Transcript_20497/g.41015  ORF Transcript_20497/g.41015 Transcript_20497/m.41015 type:complete len:226 (+) Transcript_20497:245-922(+)